LDERGYGHQSKKIIHLYKHEAAFRMAHNFVHLSPLNFLSDTGISRLFVLRRDSSTGGAALGRRSTALSGPRMI
jgi:hypothetical protein